MNKIEDHKVFKIFNEICKIPRESGNEKDISNYVVNFAKERNLEFIQDEFFNVVIKKEATIGYENEEPLILQAHLDMVCEKEKDLVHDFNTDPIEIYIEGDYIKAKGTSLGADDGIGVSLILAILDDESIFHPPLEAIFTTEEETTMNGAKNLDVSLIKAKRLISLDNNTEGEMLVSSAGIVILNVFSDVQYENIKENYIPYLLNINGLLGGHSGDEIHLGRGNAICLMARVIKGLQDKIDLQIASFSAGSKANVIPKESEIIIYINENDKEILEKEILIWNDKLKNELAKNDSNIELSCKRINGTDIKVLSKQSVNKLIEFLIKSPNGVQSMSSKIEGLVESSLNIAVVEMNDSKFNILVSIRSSVKELETKILNEIKQICNDIGIDMNIKSTASAMEYKEESEIRDICKKVYKEMYNTELKIMAVHVGVEGAVFSEKIKGIDIGLLAPNLYDIHSVNEKVSISSTIRVYEYLKEVLKQLKK